MWGKAPLLIAIVVVVAGCGGSSGKAAVGAASSAPVTAPPKPTPPTVPVARRPPVSGDTVPEAPVWGSARADATPGSSSDVLAATSDPHNPTLNDFLKALDRKHVWLRTIPGQSSGTDVRQVFFDMKAKPYSGPLVLGVDPVRRT